MGPRQSQRRRRSSHLLLPMKSNKSRLKKRPPSQSLRHSRKNWRRPIKRSPIPPRKLSRTAKRSPRRKVNKLKRRKNSRKSPEDNSDKNVPSCSQQFHSVHQAKKPEDIRYVPMP